MHLGAPFALTAKSAGAQTCQYSFSYGSENLFGLHIVALLLGFAHGEGLAGQDAVQHHAAEQVLLGYFGQLEAQVAALGGQLLQGGAAALSLSKNVALCGLFCYTKDR